MILKYVAPFLGLLLAVSSPAFADGDFYLPQIYENGEVIGCSTDESFEELLLGEEIAHLTQFCRPVMVSAEPHFIGWTMFDPPVWVDGTDDFVVARKYVMDDQDGQIRFVWPYPLEPSDYAMFSGPYEDALPQSPELVTLPDDPDLSMVPDVAVAYASY